MASRIETPRLLLIAATVPMLEADIAGPAALAAALGAALAGDWPPDLYSEAAARYSIGLLEPDGAAADWGAHYFLRKAAPRPVLIGVGGYKGAPEQGKVEIGYSVVAGAQRQGYATEAAQAMTDRAFERNDVDVVLAHTMPDLVASIGVLEKCGFRFAEGGLAEGAVRYELTRKDWGVTR